jgi:hypothetical protein
MPTHAIDYFNSRSPLRVLASRVALHVPPGDYILRVPQNSTSVILSSKIICDREALVRRTIIDDYDLEE